MVSLSKWFVGSSILITHGVISADAKETLFLSTKKFFYFLVKGYAKLVKTALASLKSKIRASIFLQ